MGFVDLVHHAWNAMNDADDKLQNFEGSAVSSIPNIFPKIGAAYTAASNVSIGKVNLGQAVVHAVKETVDPLGQTLAAVAPGASATLHAGVLGAVNGIYSNVIARPISTTAQMGVGKENFGTLLSAHDWNQAWNRSANISPGQATVTWFDNNIGIGPQWAQSDNPFADDLDKDRQQYFQNTWGGKLSSGTLDLLANVAIDPFATAGKSAKAAEIASKAIEPVDRAAALAAARDGTADLSRQGPKFTKAGQDAVRPKVAAARTTDLVNKIAGRDPAKIAAMPEIVQAPNASALATVFAKANADYADNLTERRAAITDILGTAWGDQTSMDNLLTRRAELADQLANLSMPPVQNMTADQLVWEKGGQGSFDLFNDVGSRAIASRATEIKNHMDAMRAVYTQAGQMDLKVGATVPEKIIARNRNQVFKETPVASSTSKTAYLTQGLASRTIRAVSNSSATRLPSHVNVADPNEGYPQVLQYLRAMKNTSPAVKTDLANKFVQAPSVASRIQVVNAMRVRIVKDAAQANGITTAATQKLLDAGESKLAYTRSNLKTRLYTALGNGDNNVSLLDPESDEIQSYEAPLLQSQLESHVPVLDPKLVDSELKKFTGNDWLQKYAGFSPTGAQVVGDAVEAGEAGFARLSGMWKDAALARVAYPLRIQTDSFFRQAAHMETMQFLATRAPFVGSAGKGRRAYLLSAKDSSTLGDMGMQFTKDMRKQQFQAKGKLGKIKALPGMLTPSDPNLSVKNVFKQGDYHAALRAALTHDLGNDSRWNISEGDIDDVLPHILENNGSMADLAGEITDKLLKKRRTGDFYIRHPQDQGWTPDYLRVVNRQIRNSPTARRLMATGGRTDVVAREMSTRGSKLWNEYNKVGKFHGDIEQYVQKVSDQNDYYLPHPEMQAHAAERAVTPEKLAGWFKGEEALAKPMDVHGEGYSLEKQSADKASYDKLRNGWYEFAASAPENVMARAPLFMDAYRKRLSQALTNLDDDQIHTVGVDNIRTNAMRGARKDMAKILFDASDVSNMAHSMRFISPFFAAWEDTMKKWSMLMYDKPQLLSYLQKVSQSANDVGQIPHTNHSLVVDDNGNRVDSNGRVYDSEGNRVDNQKGYESGNQYVFLPKKFTSWLPAGVGQGGIKIRKDSINSIFQGDPWWLPGFGPAIQVPANQIVRQAFPTEADDPIMKYVLPYGTTSDSVQDQLLPKWIKTARNSFGGTQDYANQYAIFLAQATIDERDGGPKVDTDKIAKKTRNFFILKAGLDNASPVSIQPDAKYQFYIDKAHEYKSNPALGANWEDKFFQDFPQYGEMAISLSANNTGIVASNAAMPAIKKYRKDIAADPKMGWMYVGAANSGDFSNGVYDWQLSNSAGQGQNFRSKKDPTQALNELEAARGWDQWNSVNTAISNELKSRGLKSVQQNGAEDLQYAKQQYTAQLAQQNKAWGQDYASAAGGDKVGELLTAATDFMGKHKDVQTRTDMVALQNYMAVRQAVKDTLATRQSTGLASNPDLQYALQAYGEQLSQDNLGFQAMWNRTLQFDNLSDIKAQTNGSS